MRVTEAMDNDLIGDHLEAEEEQQDTPVVNTVEQGNDPLDDPGYLNTNVRNDNEGEPHYEWDEEDVEEVTQSYRLGVLSTPEWRYCERKTDAVMCISNSDTRGASHEDHTHVRRLASAKTAVTPLLYDHWVQKHTTMRPSRSHVNYQTLSGFWEVNGVRAHCLLDSGCKGVMISPDFTQATGLVMFKLEQPIALQLACIGSKSTINYGVRSTISLATSASRKPSMLQTSTTMMSYWAHLLCDS